MASPDKIYKFIFKHIEDARGYYFVGETDPTATLGWVRVDKGSGFNEKAYHRWWIAQPGQPAYPGNGVFAPTPSPTPAPTTPQPTTPEPTVQVTTQPPTQAPIPTPAPTTPAPTVVVGVGDACYDDVNVCDSSSTCRISAVPGLLGLDRTCCRMPGLGGEGECEQHSDCCVGAYFGCDWISRKCILLTDITTQPPKQPPTAGATVAPTALTPGITALPTAGGTEEGLDGDGEASENVGLSTPQASGIAGGVAAVALVGVGFLVWGKRKGRDGGGAARVRRASEQRAGLRGLVRHRAGGPAPPPPSPTEGSASPARTRSSATTAAAGRRRASSAAIGRTSGPGSGRMVEGEGGRE